MTVPPHQCEYSPDTVRRGEDPPVVDDGAAAPVRVAAAEATALAQRRRPRVSAVLRLEAADDAWRRLVEVPHTTRTYHDTTKLYKCDCRERCVVAVVKSVDNTGGFSRLLALFHVNLRRFGCCSTEKTIVFLQTTGYTCVK